MKDVMHYKGFTGSVRFSAADEVFHGKLEGITDLVTYEGNSVDELKKAFKEAVEDYLELCKDTRKQIEKPLKVVLMYAWSRSFISRQLNLQSWQGCL